MCGRTACSLDPKCLSKACSQKIDKNGENKVVSPEWKEVNFGRSYNPCFNVTPGSQVPVLVKKWHITGNEKEADHVICPMQWGLVPSWFTKHPDEFKFKTINCRKDGMESKGTFRNSVLEGKRCVVLADGYFEWQFLGGKRAKKQPYFFYLPQPEGLSWWQRNWEENAHDDESWGGPSIMPMAGLFEVWRSTSQDSNEVLYTCTVITLDAPPYLKWVHNRMPAVLNGQTAIDQWLDNKNVPFRMAVDLLKPIENLHWHAVSSAVNSGSNKDIECIKPCKVSQMQNASLSSNFMMDWLKKSPATATKRPLEIKKEESDELENEMCLPKKKK